MRVSPFAVQFGTVTPPLAIAIAVAGYGYWRRARTLAAAARPVSRARQTAFYAALALLVLEPASPLGALDERSFTAHMLEHLIVGDIAALLMVLGLTGPLIQPLLRVKLIAALRPLAHPVPALAIWILSTYLWQLPLFFDAALENDVVHVVQHMIFFGAAFNLWMPLFGPLPQPRWFGNVAKMFYVAGIWLATMLIGNFFVFSGAPYYARYAAADNPFGMSATGDQSVAGAVMMIECTILTFAVLGWLFFKAAGEGEESQRLIELADAHGVALSGERSARAAAAGTTGLLRERIVSGLDIPED